MSTTRFFTGASLVLLAGNQVAALQSKNSAPPMAAVDVAVDRSCLPTGAYRQKLDNMMDLQYHGRLQLGSQEIRGIIDTGSFELVVFSKSCSTCGKAAAFDEKSSSTFINGNHSTVHSYGSGSCMSTDGWDEVNLACLGARSQSMWLAQQCQMPALMVANFNAIVGVGPPGQPEYMARAQLDQLAETEAQMAKEGKPVPDQLKEVKSKLQVMLDDALSKPALLSTFGMKTFSQCLGKQQGAPGYMVWNDITRADRPETKRIHVAGNITWGIQIEEVAFAMPDGAVLPFGCEKGCGAVVDTGTSLMAVPTSAYKGAIQVLQQNAGAGDCSDLSKFPDLVVKLNGHSFRLPPSSYLGTLEGSMMSETARFMHLNSLTEPNENQTAAVPNDAIPKKAEQDATMHAVVEAAKAAAQAAASAAAAATDASSAAEMAAGAAKAAAGAAAAAAHAAASAAAVAAGQPMPEGAPQQQPTPKSSNQCQLLMMDLGEKNTPLGPMFILGMPWFRQFYTTFDLGSGRGDRNIYVTPAGDTCDPDEVKTGAVKAYRSTEAFTPRHLDASKIRGPRWLDGLPDGAF